MNAPATVALKPYQLAALLVLFMTAFAAPLTTAFNIGAIITEFGASRVEAGFVMTAEGLSVAASALIASRLITRYYLKTLLFGGLICVAAGSGLTLLATDVPMMVGCRILAGIGIGTVVSTVMATAARTPKPEMTFGWVNGCAGAFISVLGLTVPFAILRGGLDGAYALYLALSLFGMLLLLLIPNSKTPVHAAPASRSEDKPLSKFSASAGWIALFGLGIFFFGQAGIAAFIERIGASIDVSLSTVGTIFFFGGLLTIVGPIGAGIVGSRFGATKPLVLIGSLFCLTVLVIALGGDKMSFYLSVPLLMILPAILLPSFLGGLAVVDPTGRLAGAQPAFATMGGALGPVAAGAVADVGGFGTLGWFVFVMLIIGLTLMAAATLKADGIELGRYIQPSDHLLGISAHQEFITIVHPRLFAQSHPDNIAAIMGDGSGSLSYAELERRANQGAHYFRSMGLQNRAAMAIWVTNRTEFFEIYWAAQRAGLYIVPISTQLSAEDAAYIVNDSGAKLLVWDFAVRSATELVEKQRALIPEATMLPLTNWQETISAFPETPIADELAGTQMVYSSGTTGRPKGVRVTMPDMPADAAIPRVDGFAQKYGFDDQSVLLCPAPLYHTAPLIFSTLPQRTGVQVVVMPKFDPEQMLQWIEKHRVTFVQMVPTMFIRLLKLPQNIRERYDLSSLQIVLHAAAPCPVEVKHAMLEWMGPIIHEYYAGSEGNGATSISPQEWLQKPGSVGKADMGIIHICAEDGQELPVGEPGLIYFEGGNEFAYFNDDEKTREARNPLHENWTTMGDIGRLDEDGYLYLTDRKSFMIISGGVNIYPQETENFLVQHPEVADVAVIGVPHPEMGEEVKAIVQPARWEDRGAELSDRLMAYCRDNLSHIKCPKSIDFDRELPRHETGKLYKKQLMKRYWT